MTSEKAELDETTPIDFRFATFGELKQVFGEKRARSLVQAKQRKAAGSAEALSPADIETALKFLRGEKAGAQTSRALKALRYYFAHNERARKGCEAYLEGLDEHDEPNHR